MSSNVFNSIIGTDIMYLTVNLDIMMCAGPYANMGGYRQDKLRLRAF